MVKITSAARTCDWSLVTHFPPLCLKSRGDFPTVGLFYGHSLDITAAQAQTAFAAHQNAQQSAGALVRSHDGPIVDYLALHLLDGWNEVSTALASQKIA